MANRRFLKGMFELVKKYVDPQGVFEVLRDVFTKKKEDSDSEVNNGTKAADSVAADSEANEQQKRSVWSWILAYVKKEKKEASEASEAAKKADAKKEAAKKDAEAKIVAEAKKIDAEAAKKDAEAKKKDAEAKKDAEKAEPEPMSIWSWF